MEMRDFKFEIQEIKHKPNPKMPDGKEAYIFTTTGVAMVRSNGEIDIVVDDPKQDKGSFVVTDGFFKKLIRKIHESIK